MDTLATIQAILAAETYLVKISTLILLVSGNISEVLNIIIFTRRNFRNNPCAIYFLAASCARLFFIDWTILLNGLSLSYGIDPAYTSIIFCKIKYYLSYLTAILPPYFIVLACFDRLMLSSLNPNMRLWSQRRSAYRLTAIVLVCWMIITCHCFYGSIIYYGPGYSFCSTRMGSYGLFLILYSIIIEYSLPPILMTILGLLTIFNVRRTQRQIHPNGRIGSMQRKDRHLLRMLLFQVLINVVFTIPAAVFEVYGIITVDWNKGIIWQYWDYFFLTLILAVFYIPYCTSFYIYTLTASIFRKELKRLILHCYRRFFPRRQTAVTIAATNFTQTMRNPTVHY